MGGSNQKHKRMGAHHTCHIINRVRGHSVVLWYHSHHCPSPVLHVQSHPHPCPFSWPAFGIGGGALKAPHGTTILSPTPFHSQTPSHCQHSHTHAPCVFVAWLFVWPCAAHPFLSTPLAVAGWVGDCVLYKFCVVYILCCIQVAVDMRYSPCVNAWLCMNVQVEAPL